MEIHAGIIKQFGFIGNSLMIEFKRSIKLLATKRIKNTDKKKVDVFTNWTWTKNVNDIINYDQVMAFLKSLDLTNSTPIEQPLKTDNKDIQQSLF